MRVPVALLADHAMAHPIDGKLYVTGGGIPSLPFRDFPATQPHLSLALGIEMEPHELGVEHSLSIESVGPTDEAVAPPIRVTFSVPPGRNPSWPGYFHFVSNMDDVAFPVEGDYAFLIAIDSNQLNTVTVRAERSADATLAAELGARQEAADLINKGYAAFSRGDVAAAEDAFRLAIERFPTLAPAHNNLGFTLLAKGDAPAALEAFKIANQLGYPQSEIGDANLACALYLSGDPTAALPVFEDCLQTHLFTTSAILFGIGPEGLFPAYVSSAAEYASLINLNAAWSALGAGDLAAAHRYLAAARAVVPVLKGQGSALAIVESSDALSARIDVPAPGTRGAPTSR